jgi:hypothetical protein
MSASLDETKRSRGFEGKYELAEVTLVALHRTSRLDTVYELIRKLRLSVPEYISGQGNKYK